MDKDITTRVIACKVNIQETPASKDMTKHPVFVLFDKLVIEAFQKWAAEKRKAIVAAVEGVETNWGASVSGTLTQVSLPSTINIAQVLSHVTYVPIIPKLKRKIEKLELKK